jgi:plastocyanin
MRRLTTLAGALALTACLATAPAASAANQTVQAVDGSNTWSPPSVTVTVGETVTWSFAGTTGVHNVASTSPNWSFRSEFGTGQAPESFTFGAPGTYTFVCEVHASTMTGSVTVTDAGGNPPPPPPPPPPSEQPFPNDAAPLGGFESGGLDRKRPNLRRVRVKGLRHGARVRFRVSERARVAVRFKVRGIPVKTKRVRAAGRRTVTVRGLRRGRYRVVVRAVDPAGNRSRARVRRVYCR